jgi:hypothetical protein
LSFECSAAVAGNLSRRRRSEVRQGVDMDREDFERVLEIIRPVLTIRKNPLQRITGAVTCPPSCDMITFHLQRSRSRSVTVLVVVPAQQTRGGFAFVNLC